jgi:hypothetical protein
MVMWLTLISPAFAGCTIKTEMLSDGGLVMQGHYLNIGMDDTLVMGTWRNPSTIPSEFPSGVGIQVDPDCWGNGAAPINGDYFLPGSPEEGYAVRYTKSGSRGLYKCSRNGYHGCAFSPSGLTDLKTDSSLGATGSVQNSDLKITQTISFDADAWSYKTELEFCNIGGTTLENIRYTRNMDPDQDQKLHGSYGTYVTQKVINAQRLRGADYSYACSKGDRSPATMCYYSTVDDSAVYIGGFANYEPDAGYFSSVQAEGYRLRGDNGMTIMLPAGDLAPSECKTVDFYVVLDTNPTGGVIDTLGGPVPTPAPTTELAGKENHDSISGSFVLEFSEDADAASAAAAFDDEATRATIEAALAKAIAETIGCDPSEISIRGVTTTGRRLSTGKVSVDYVISVLPGEGEDLAERIEAVDPVTSDGAFASKVTEELKGAGIDAEVVEVDPGTTVLEEVTGFPTPSPTPAPTVSEFYGDSCMLDTFIEGIELDPKDLCEVGENGWSTWDHDSFNGQISLKIEKKEEHEDAFRKKHKATIGELKDETEKDARYILHCPQIDAGKSLQFTVNRPANLTEFGGEWVQLFKKDSWENVTNEYEPFTFNDFGAKIPLLNLRPVPNGRQNDEDAPLDEDFVVYMAVAERGDYEVKYGNPRLQFDDKWIANEFKSTLLRVGTPWADCSDDKLGTETYDIGAIIPATYGHPNLQKHKYEALIAELQGAKVDVSVVLEIFNKDIKSTCPADAPVATKADPFEFSCWTSSTNYATVYTECYEAGNACPEGHQVCESFYCELDTWAEIIDKLKKASPGNIKVLGQLDAETTPTEYSQLDMDGFYFVDPAAAKESTYYGTDYSVIAVSEPLFDSSMVDVEDTVYVTLLDDAENIGVWTPYSWYPKTPPKKWAAMISKAPLSTNVEDPISGKVDDLVSILFDRGYGHVFLTTEDDFTEPSPVGFTKKLLKAIADKSTPADGRRLMERELSVKSETFWGCDDTRFECKPACYKRTGLVTSKVSDRYCTDAPMDACSCKCYHDAQWVCQGEEVVCQASYGGEEPRVVGDLLCTSRGTPKPEMMELRERQAQQCEPLPTLKDGAPSQQCLDIWAGTPEPSVVPEAAQFVVDLENSALLLSLGVAAVLA